MYSAPPPGKYKLRVEVNSQQIKNSPFDVVVRSLIVDPLRCHASGDGLEQADHGVPAIFHIFTSNKIDVPTSAGHKIDLQMSSVLSKIKYEWSEVESGKYLVKYWPVCEPTSTTPNEGVISARITIGGVDISGSPYSIPVAMSPAQLLFPMKPKLGVEVSREAVSGKGLKVINVTRNGPVFKAGICPGEWITEVDGIQLRSWKDFEHHLVHITPGDVLDVSAISKNDVTRTATIIAESATATLEEVQNLRELAGITARRWDRGAHEHSH